MELKTRHKLERKRLARRLKGQTLAVINRARHGLAMKQREERRSAAAPRPRTGSPSGRKRQSFKAWLKAHGRDQQADRWRYRSRPLPAPSSSSTPPAAKPDEALAAYAAHWEIHQKQNARIAALAAGMALFGKIPSKLPESSSRLDARIALLMRTEGHSREAVAEAIRRSAPELRGGENRDWRRYAARTASYAFGLGGDMELARMPQVSQVPSMEPKPMESPPPPPKQSEDEAWRERPRLRMR